MVNPEALTARGLRAYELGRLLVALRVALLVLPVATLCLLERTGRELCAGMAVVLLGSAVLLRWRNRRGVEAVATGLYAGGLPLFAGVLLARCGLTCGVEGTASFCTGLQLLVGLGAGVMISRREARLGARVSSLLAAGAIAGLAAGLGCVRLGVLGVTSMLAGLLFGSFGGALASGRSRR